VAAGSSVATVPLIPPRPLQGYRLRISGRYAADGRPAVYLYEGFDAAYEVRLSELDLVQMGFTIRHMDECNALISYSDGYKTYINCHRFIPRFRVPSYGSPVMGDTAQSVITSAVSNTNTATLARAGSVLWAVAGAGKGRGLV
jgi:hypothetical protein